MSKYIDAEKLKAEIDKKRKILISEYNELAKYEVWRSANNNKIKINTISDILSLITSLQQEQPEVNLDNNTIMEEIRKCGCNPNEFDIARHFFELGKSRKEE